MTIIFTDRCFKKISTICMEME